MTITVKGVAFLKATNPNYAVGRRVVITAVLDPTAGNITALDAGKGAAVTVPSVPVLSISYYDTEELGYHTVPSPGSFSVEFGVVQSPYRETGERMVTLRIPDQQGTYHDGNATLTAFVSAGTIFEAPIESVPPADTGIPGTGLLGRWYGNRDLVGTPTAETVGPVYLRGIQSGNTVYPGGFPPVQLSSGDRYSVRWTGALKAPSTGQYRFRIEADDGFRFYVGGRLELDFWSDQNRRTRLSGTFDWTAGELIPIWIELYNKGGGDDRGWIEFDWEVNGALFTPVPTTALYSTDGSEAIPPALAPPPQSRCYIESINRYEESP